MDNKQRIYSTCKSSLKPLFISWFCPNDCDRKANGTYTPEYFMWSSLNKENYLLKKRDQVYLKVYSNLEKAKADPAQLKYKNIYYYSFTGNQVAEENGKVLISHWKLVESLSK